MDRKAMMATYRALGEAYDAAAGLLASIPITPRQTGPEAANRTDITSAAFAWAVTFASGSRLALDTIESEIDKQISKSQTQ